MSEPTNIPTPPQKPQVDINPGFTAFIDEAKNRVLGVTHFKSRTIAFSSAKIVTKPTFSELQSELTKMGLSYTPPAPPQA
jgi:hypothetical protein